MTFIKQLVLLSMFLIFANQSIRAQDQNFIHLSTRSGLPSGFIYEITEDRYGYIWAGTSIGLSQYNGYEFVNYLKKLSDSTSLNGTRVHSIDDYDSTYMIIGTDQGLNVFDRVSNSFSLITSNDSINIIRSVVDVLALPDNEMWVLTSEGLFHINKGQVLTDIVNTNFFPLEKIGSGGTGDFGFVKQDLEGNLWMGSSIHPLQIFDPTDEKFKDIPSFKNDIDNILTNPIWDISFAKNGDIIIGGDVGMLHWKKGKTSPIIIEELGGSEPVKMEFIQSIELDKDGKILIGTAYSGGVRWNLSTDEAEVFSSSSSDQNSIHSNDVHHMFEDSNENVWFGHHALGISMMYSNKLDYTYVDLARELGTSSSFNDLFHMTEDSNGDFWFPSVDGLIYESKNSGIRKVFNTQNKDGFRISIEVEDQLFLVASDGQTMYAFNKREEKFTQLHKLDSTEIHPHFTENETHLFFPTMTGNIVMVDKSSYETKVVEIPRSEVIEEDILPNGINRDVEGNLIVEMFYPTTTEMESFLFDPSNQTFSKYDVKRELNATRVPPTTSRFETQVMWERNVYGLNKTDLVTGQSRVLFESEPLIQEGQRGTIVEDNDGYIWMNNATGIMQLDPINQSITHYTIPKAYQPQLFAKPFSMENGDILFTGSGGYLRFNPSKAKLETPLNGLYIKELGFEDQSYDLFFEHVPKNINYTNNDLSITYFALNFPDPNGTRYRYRVIGHDNNWVEVGSQRRVFLANLPSGRYTFEVEAAARYGGYDITKSIDFVILSPWWQRWWAYIFYLFIGVAIFLSVYRSQKERTIRKERERIKDEQLSQAKEIEQAYSQLKETQTQLIHSEKMASLGELTAGIAHEIQNPLNFVNNFSDLNGELLDDLKEAIVKNDQEEIETIYTDLKDNESKINHHGRRAEEIVRSMLQHSRGGDGEKELTDINALADEYLRLSYHGLRAKDKSFNAEFKADLDPDVPKINVVPQDIGRVLLNLINNAFQAVSEKRMKAESGYDPTVTLTTKLTANGHLQIAISDNGPGIPDHIKDKIFQPFFTTKATGEGTGLGLSMSYDIVTKGHGGTIEVNSSEKGTDFIVSLNTN